MWFGCSLNNICVRENHHADRIYQKFQDDITNALSSYLRITGELSGNKMMEDYFPTIDSDIFICHSHNDEEKAKYFAGWLYEHFQLRAFVDSMVWGSADALLKKIDDAYCYNPNNKTYYYNNRNLSTSYVHMMLAASLAKMMEKCTCLFFIESEQTIKPSAIKDSKETFSPWIFYELALFHKIHKEAPRVKMNFSKIASARRSHRIDEAAMEGLEIALGAETKDLRNLTESVANDWQESGIEKLPALYKLHELLFPEEYPVI